jgi:prepilin-type N-terminal cleavage/methylation domain-containing protein
MADRARRGQSGFGLIEVVVALAIVALMLGVTYQISSISVRSTARSENYLRALATAKSALAEASALPVLRIGTVVGSTDGVAWSRSVKPYSAPSPTPDTRLFQVAVIATRHGSRVTLETVVLAGAARE